MDLLQSLINPNSANAIQSGQSAPSAQAVPSVEGITVPAPPRQTSSAPIQLLPGPSAPSNLTSPPNLTMDAPVSPMANQSAGPAGLDYNNSSDVTALNAQMNANTPRGGMANPGLYGLLPAGMQHGTMRNVLGALGDAFLVGSNRPAEYEPRMERQEIGNAMAGYNPNDPNSVQAAIQRVAATGATGSPEMADQMQKNATENALKNATLEQNNWYRQNTINNRNDTALARMTPYIGGMVAGANDKPSYTSAYNRAEAIAQRIGPDYHASDFGLVDPDNWTPGATSTTGMTRNNVQQSYDRSQQRATSERNTDVNAASRIRAAGISGGSHIESSEIAAAKPTDATMTSAEIAKQNSGQTLTPAEQAHFDHTTQVSHRSRALPANLTVGGGKAAPSKFQNGGVYKDAHGNRARYVNGSWISIK